MRGIYQISMRGETVNIVAKQVGLSPTTYQRAKTIVEKAPEELKEKVRSGETSINYAYKQVKRAQEHKETPVLPHGKFIFLTSAAM